MIGAGPFGRKQEEHDIDRLAVDGVEVDRLGKAREDADDALEPGELAVGNGDALAEPGGAEPLALQQNVEDFAFRKPGETGGAGGKILKELFLGLRLERGHDRIGGDEITKKHLPTPLMGAVATTGRKFA